MADLRPHAPAYPTLMAVLQAVLIFTAGVPAIAQVHRWDAPFRTCELHGALLQGDSVVAQPTYAAGAEEPLRVEAELLQTITGPVERLPDDGAGGGEALVVSDGTYTGTGAAVVMPVHVVETGRYRLWVRTFWPDIGGNSFYLSLDGGEDATYGNTEGAGRIGVWHWEPGPIWALDAGLHTITVRWREDGTVLDSLLLAPAGYEPSDGAYMGKSAEPGPPPYMEVTTTALRPTRVDAWARADIAPEAVGAWAAISASTDGEHWAPVSGGDLSGIASAGRGDDALRVRVRMENPSMEIALRGLSVTYRGGPWMATLRNDSSAFDFDLADGSCIGIRNLITGTTLARGGQPLFSLDYLPRDGGTIQTVAPKDVTRVDYRLADDAKSLEMRFRAAMPGGHCMVRCHVALPDGGLPTWWIEVENHAEGADIVEVHYPRIGGVRIGDDPGDDVLIWPRWGCRRIPEPARNAPGRVLYPSGRAMMNWLDVYEPGGGAQGLYVASQDETSLVGELVAAQEDGGATLTLGMSKMPRVEPGERFRSEDFVVAPHQGDWHWAADRYREWLGTWLPKPSPPAWLVDCDGWLGTGRGSNFRKDIPERYRLARRLGLDYVEFWGQMTVGMAINESCCNRLYFPDPRYGTEAEFAEAISYVRQAGGHIGFYTNGQAWNPRYPQLRDWYKGLMPADAYIPDWEGGFKQNALRKPDGRLYGQYDKPPGDPSPYDCSFYLMCSAAKGWQDYLHHYVADKYIGEYGVDAMYIDQVGAADASPCYCREHGHEDIGAWGRGHLENFRRIRADGRAHEPELALATEGLVDIYGQYVDIFLISPVASRRWPDVAPEVLAYTLPEYICFDGFANGMTPDSLTGRQTVNEVFLMGQRFDIFERTPEEMEHITRVIRLRQETGPLLYRGGFRDDIGLSVTDDRVRAKLWQLDEDTARGWLVNVYNEQAVEGVQLRVSIGDTPDLRALVATLDEPLHEAPVTIDQGVATVDAPTSELSTIVLLTDAQPWLARAMAPVTADRQSAVELRFRPLLKPTGDQAVAELSVPGGWTADRVRFQADGPRDVVLPFAAPPETPPGIYPVTVRLRVGERTWESTESIIIEEPLEVALNMQTGRLAITLRNRSGANMDTECVATGPAWLHFGPAVAVTIPAGQQTLCAIPWSAPAGVPEIGQVRVDVRAGGRTFSAQTRIEPLESSVDRWSPARYEGSVEAMASPEELALSSKSVTDRGGWRWSTLLVEPGARYRFSVQCRTRGVRSEKEGVRIRIIFFDRDDGTKAAGPPVMTVPLTGDNDWTAIAPEFEVPERTGRVQVELMHWHAAGESWWREPRLERVTGAE